MKGAVASGHPLTSRAATEMLAHGGNAFDAAVSAGFASVVTEPTLTSLGGGGFLLAHIENEEKNLLFDFFVNTPGLDNAKSTKPAMKPVEIKFPGCTQVFHTGFGSVAVPGMLKGLLYIHKRLCTLPIETILIPALMYLEEGVEINEKQGVFLDYLEPIFTLSDYGRHIFIKDGRYVKRYDRIHNPLLKDFLYGMQHNEWDIYSGEITGKLVEDMEEQGGIVSRGDLDAYRVIEREPLCITYRDREIITNPPPSFGGIMLALSLKLLEDIDLSAFHHDSEEYLTILIELMKKMDNFRAMKKIDWLEEVTYPFTDRVTASLIRSYKKNISRRMFISTQGTTHISVIDEEGNAASMTTSNGSGSGHFIPETGIMLNNMMGEDDLHPNGFFVSPPGKRVSSMMAPTIIMKKIPPKSAPFFTKGGNKGGLIKRERGDFQRKKRRIESVMGSGGSKRIRTAILHALINIIDFNFPLKEAIEAYRVHFEDGKVQAEPGIPADVLYRLKKQYDINIWSKKNMYFGGVHAVNVNMEGRGDSRRDGNFLRFSQEPKK